MEDMSIRWIGYFVLLFVGVFLLGLVVMPVTGMWDSLFVCGLR